MGVARRMMGEKSYAPGHGPAVARGSVGVGDAGPEPAAGADRRRGGLGAARAGRGGRARRRPRAAQLSAAADGEGAAAPAVVHPLGPPDGRGAGRPALLPALRGAGPAGRHARPLHHQPLSPRVGGRRAQRAVVYGAGGATGRAGPGAEAGHAAGRHPGGVAGAAPAAGGGARGAGRRAPPIQRRRGPNGGGAAAPTLATRCIWGWMRTRAWCGGRR